MASRRSPLLRLQSFSGDTLTDIRIKFGHCATYAKNILFAEKNKENKFRYSIDSAGQMTEFSDIVYSAVCQHLSIALWPTSLESCCCHFIWHFPCVNHDSRRCEKRKKYTSELLNNSLNRNRKSTEKMAVAAKGAVALKGKYSINRNRIQLFSQRFRRYSVKAIISTRLLHNIADAWSERTKKYNFPLFNCSFMGAITTNIASDSQICIGRVDTTKIQWFASYS